MKVIRKNDPDFGLTEDEIQDRNEFIRCFILSEFEQLMMLPRQDSGDDFFIVGCDVFDDEYSAFNTHDFQRNQRPFNKYAYAVKMIMERIKDLAIMHSCISSSEGRQDIFHRYEGIVSREYRDRLPALANRYQKEFGWEDRIRIKQKIENLMQSFMMIWGPGKWVYIFRNFIFSTIDGLVKNQDLRISIS